MGKSRKEKDFFCVLLLSLPARGAWIEIIYGNTEKTTFNSRSPQGERGLKYYSLY